MNKHRIIITAIALFCAVATFAQHRDIIYMNDGSELIGELVKISESEVTFRMSDGDKILDADSVRSIDLGRWRPGDDWKNRIEIDDPVLEAALERADEDSRKYTSAGYITLYEKGELIIDNSESAVFTQRRIYYIANESGKSKANWSTRYFSDVQEVSVDFGRAVGLSKISTVADNAIEDGSTNPLLGEYQRQRSKKFALTGASLGSVVDYQVTIKYNKLDIFNGIGMTWRFYDTEPIFQSIFEVLYKGNIDIVFNDLDAPKPEKIKRDGYTGVSYRMENIEPYIEESMLPNLDLVFPNVSVTIPADMSKLSAAYNDKIVGAMDDVASVKSRLDAEFEDEKPTIEQVYNYVAENYTTNGIGMRDYYPYPKPLSEILTMSRIARHDIAFLLYCFLDAAGYDAELVMLGPSLDTPLLPEMFNIRHFSSGLRVRVLDDETVRYLAPNEYLRFDHQFLSGIWILPVAESGANLEQIPRVDGDYAYGNPHYECQLSSDGTLKLEYTVTYKGPTGGDRYRYHKNDKPREIDNYFEGMAKNIDGMANIVDYKLVGIESLEDRVVMTYRVEVPGYAVRAGEEILAFKLPTVSFGSSQVGAKERTLPFSLFGNIYSEKSISIDLPDGYEIDHLPKSVDLSSEFRFFDGDLSFENGRIEYRQVITGEHAPIVKSKKYGEYKNLIEKRSKFADNWILIRKSS